MNNQCQHLDQVKDLVSRDVTFCDECQETGQAWVALRQCQTCGHVGCCDSSVGRHATAHFETTGHAIMKSVQPGQDFTWCYADKIYL